MKNFPHGTEEDPLCSAHEADPPEDEMDVWTRFSTKYPELANAFLTSFQEQLDLLAAKMLDYGTDNLKAGTQLKTEKEIKFALEGIWFRINDKVQRWKNMIFTEATPNNESLYDTFMDIANYGIIAKLISRGVWDNR